MVPVQVARYVVAFNIEHVNQHLGKIKTRRKRKNKTQHTTWPQKTERHHKRCLWAIDNDTPVMWPVSLVDVSSMVLFHVHWYWSLLILYLMFTSYINTHQQDEDWGGMSWWISSNFYYEPDGRLHLLPPRDIFISIQAYVHEKHEFFGLCTYENRKNCVLVMNGIT